jgi:hypothetical protein
LDGRHRNWVCRGIGFRDVHEPCHIGSYIVVLEEGFSENLLGGPGA